MTKGHVMISRLVVVARSSFPKHVYNFLNTIPFNRSLLKGAGCLSLQDKMKLERLRCISRVHSKVSPVSVWYIPVIVHRALQRNTPCFLQYRQRRTHCTVTGEVLQVEINKSHNFSTQGLFKNTSFLVCLESDFHRRWFGQRENFNFSQGYIWNISLAL